MSLTLIPLASGSKGNATLVKNGGTVLMVDAGMGVRELSARILSCGVYPSEIEGILITHEHSDHIAGAVTFVKKYGCKLYVHKKILERTHLFESVDDYVIEIEDGSFAIDGIGISCFRVPHDAIYTMGYSFTADGSKVSVVTDLGLVTRPVYDNIYDSDVLMLESNHDIDMLAHSKYPQYLIQRIRGANGHLSNADCAETVSRLGAKLKTVVLAHLSEENNREELALDATRCKLGGGIILCAAKQREPTGIFGANGNVVK